MLISTISNENLQENISIASSTDISRLFPKTVISIQILLLRYSADFLKKILNMVPMPFGLLDTIYLMLFLFIYGMSLTQSKNLQTFSF